MPVSPKSEEGGRSRVLIPLDAQAAMRALMEFRHSREAEPAPPEAAAPPSGAA